GSANFLGFSCMASFSALNKMAFYFPLVRVQCLCLNFLCLIDGLCKISKLKIARELFQSLPRAGLMPNVVTYNILIRGLCNDGQMDETKHYETVFLLFKRLNSTGLFPDLYTYNILINCFCKIGRVSSGFVIFGRILPSCFTPDAVTFTSLIKILEINSFFRQVA
ncbi:hypothetical protein CISIN_1g0431911mg, partial [Citrus sinensis]